MSLEDKTVLVTGATGFLGGAIVRQLSAQGAQVRALARRPDRDRYIRDISNVEIVMGDITNHDQIQDAMQGVNLVIHSAAALGGKLTHQRGVNRDGTANLMTAAANTGIERVVHISTISVYGYTNEEDVTENTPPSPGKDAYGITKLEAEESVIRIANAHSLSYSIIRPGMIYGPRSSAWTKTMFQVARRKPTIFIGKGNGSAYPIYVDDVANMAILAATHPAADGEVFNCTPDPSPTWREFIGTYAALAGHQSWLGLPPVLFIPLAHGLAAVSQAHTPQKDLPDMLPFLQRYITYRTDKAHAILDWQPQVDLQTGVAQCAPYLREKGLLN